MFLFLLINAIRGEDVQYNITGTDVVATGAGDINSNGLDQACSQANITKKRITSITIYPEVEKINQYTFDSCLALKKVDFVNIQESNMTELGTYAFKLVTGLEHFDFPPKVLIIGRWLFYCCFHLQSVTFLENCLTKTISEGAFYSCSALESIYIPPSITTIEKNNWKDDDVLMYINVDPRNPNYCNDTQGILYNKNMSILETCPYGVSGDVVVPESVVELGYCSFFDCSHVTHIQLPKNLKIVGEASFYGCLILEEINLPPTVEEIGMQIFGTCEKITSIVMPPKITDILWYTFSLCRSLVSVEMSEEVTHIGERAFFECHSLVNIHLPQCLKQLDKEAFLDCPVLASIIIPGKVTHVGNQCFSLCVSLKEVTYCGSTELVSKSIFHGCTNLTAVYLTTLYTYENFCCLNTSILHRILDADCKLIVSATSTPTPVIPISYTQTPNSSASISPTSDSSTFFTKSTIIITSTVGGALLLIIIIIVVYVCARSKKKQDDVLLKTSPLYTN